MRKRNDELQSVTDFSRSMTALGEAAGYPSAQTIEKRAKSEYRRSLFLAVADLALQPIVEIQQAHADQMSQHDMAEADFSSKMTIHQIRHLADQGEGVIIYPFKG